jgi:hypothetical protein
MRNGRMSAVDWGTVIAAGITGLVGIAGIGGTLLSARMTGKSDAENLRTSITAEDGRARLAEKRRVYANCLARLTDGFFAATIVKTYEGKHTEAEYKAAVLECNRARVVATNALHEVKLIGPPNLGSLATSAVRSLLRLLEGDNTEFSRVQAELTLAMRADLGEPD